MIDHGKIKQIKKSTLLKKILILTKDNKLSWKYKTNNKSEPIVYYTTKYKISETKYIIININNPHGKKKSIIFTYFNDNKYITTEITEIYPFNELSTLSYYYLNIILNKIVKNIKIL